MEPLRFMAPAAQGSWRLASFQENSALLCRSEPLRQSYRFCGVCSQCQDHCCGRAHNSMSEVHLSCRATRHGSVGRTLNAGNAGLGWGCCCLQQLRQHGGHSSAPRRPHCPSGHTTPEALCSHRKSVILSSTVSYILYRMPSGPRCLFSLLKMCFSTMSPILGTCSSIYSPSQEAKLGSAASS